jgi:hypothetical protein
MAAENERVLEPGRGVSDKSRGREGKSSSPALNDAEDGRAAVRKRFGLVAGTRDDGAQVGSESVTSGRRSFQLRRRKRPPDDDVLLHVGVSF